MLYARPMAPAAAPTLRWTLCAALALSGGALAGPARLDLAVRLEPDRRELHARGTLTVDGDATEIVLAQQFDVIAVKVDDRAVDARGAVRDGVRVWRLSAAQHERRVEIEWRGTLAALDASISHRETLQQTQAVADPRGSFLPAATSWHPTVAHGFSRYRVAIDLPDGQKGLAPGRRVEESESDGRYRARFEFPHPSDGVDLMAGPYLVASREMRTAGGKAVRLRTYFHPPIAALAEGYLDAVVAYIDRYDRAIGAYPFGEFSVVSSPTPTGFGMPTLTYLGVDVLRLPFLRATSLGHEVLHNWWGNGVYPDHARGNWAEGLTTFMADYAYREREGPDAARAMRLEWLRDFASLPPGEDRPLAAFTARTHGASQIVGYHKAAMVFLMLRDRIGAEAFDAGVRRFWRERRFKVASWTDLARAFEAAHGASLEPFFAQWLDRPGAPRVTLAAAAAARDGARHRVRVELAQDVPAYRLRVPLAVRTAGGESVHTLALADARQSFTIAVDERPLAVALDPDLRLFRRLAADEAPPILRGLMVDPSTALVVASPALAGAAQSLAARLLDHPPRLAGAGQPPPAAPLLVVGLHADVDAWLARTGLPARPPQAAKGDGQVWIAPRGKAGAVGLVSVRDAASLAALARPLPHYGRQSWLVLEAGRVIERGTWPAKPQERRLD
jgi:aminopeptidase N